MRSHVQSRRHNTVLIDIIIIHHLDWHGGACGVGPLDFCTGAGKQQEAARGFVRRLKQYKEAKTPGTCIQQALSIQELCLL